MSQTLESNAALPLEAGRSPSKETNIPFAHRVSLVSSMSSGSIVPLTYSDKQPTSLKRHVSSISSAENSVECTEAYKHLKASPVNSEGRLTCFQNARILQRDGSLMYGSITVNQDSGLIVDISLDACEEEKHGEDLMQLDQSKDVQVIDCKNQIISPGFIDIQLNGAYGVDFSNADESPDGLTLDDMFELAQKLLATGVTSFCPTMVSSSRETYRRIISLIRKARDRQCIDKAAGKRGANILRMHLEGPFFAPSKRGAHDSAHIFAPSEGIVSVTDTYGLKTSNDGIATSCLDDVDIITMAPELDGAQDAIKSLTAKTDTGHSVVVSCGHTDASYEDGIEAITNGATLLTHLYNAMNPFHHRKPGLVGLLSSELKLRRSGLERPFYSMIVDGIHVHEAAVSMAYNSHPSGCVLVTDAMAAMGLGDGTHSLGGMSVDIRGDRATLTGTDTLAGSVVSMDTCVRRFRQYTGCSIGEALLCATLHPAMVLRRHVARHRTLEKGVSDAPIGVLEVGAAADLVMLNDQLEVLGTVVGGAMATGLSSKG